MIVPRYWAEARAVLTVKGRRMTLRRFGWSDEPPSVGVRRRLDDFLARHREWRVRVYRTPAGMRMIATHTRFAPRSDATRALFDALGVDPVYARMCLNQNCFRARLSAKPWRAGIQDHLKPRPGVWPIRPERLPDRTAWVERYERAAAAYAACRYEETLGNGSDEAGLMAWVALHDAESAALGTARPLA